MIDPIRLFAYVFAAFGFAFGLGFSEITLGLRNWIRSRGVIGLWIVRLMECPACLGWHIGLWSGWFWLTPKWLIGSLIVAFATCGTNFLLGQRTGLIRS